VTTHATSSFGAARTSPGELSADDDEMIERRPFVRTAFGIRAISNNEEGKNKLPEPRIIAVQVT
jgi:hypothetical protein